MAPDPNVILWKAVAQLQDWAGSMPGIKEAPDEPPETANQFPFAISYAREGEFGLQSKGWGIGLHDLVTEIHFSRQSLPAAVKQAMPYLETWLDFFIADPKVGGFVDTVETIEYEFGQLEYGNTQTLGWVFTTRAKLIRSE